MRTSASTDLLRVLSSGKMPPCANVFSMKNEPSNKRSHPKDGPVGFGAHRNPSNQITILHLGAR
jgi:hypothetical protein